mgnify:FL=1|tara:strand:- start:343 stop:1356 length:1014 start_codon:yes stop_codon:yes gene_type:complete
MPKYQATLDYLKDHKKKWLITGVGGFIGSNLLEKLLKLDQSVIGIDNFSTGYKDNLKSVKNSVDKEQWENFSLIEGDIKDLEICQQGCDGVDYVLHQAALGSVPRSIKDPVNTNISNVDGFLNILVAARDSAVKNFIYAASSSTYGDHPDLPKKEHLIGNPLSPYAVSKYVNELYASVFSRTFRINTVGLRYFNVFGKRQDPKGSYAAVIPRWIDAFIKNEPVYIFGDGSTSRDFCYIENVIQANLLAAISENLSESGEIFNIAVGDRTTLNQLTDIIKKSLPSNSESNIIFEDFRDGDVKHSQADISKAKKLLGYEPYYNVEQGISETINWFLTES